MVKGGGHQLLLRTLKDASSLNPKLFPAVLEAAHDVDVLDLPFWANIIMSKEKVVQSAAYMSFWDSFASICDARMTSATCVSDENLALLAVSLKGRVGTALEERLSSAALSGRPLSHKTAACFRKGLPESHHLGASIEKRAIVPYMSDRDATMVFPHVHRESLNGIDLAFAATLQPLGLAHFLRACSRHQLTNQLQSLVPLVLDNVRKFDSRSFAMVVNSYSQNGLQPHALSTAVFSEACSRIRRDSADHFFVTSLLNVCTKWPKGAEYARLAADWCVHYPSMSVESLCNALHALTKLQKHGVVGGDQLVAFLRCQYDYALATLPTATMQNTSHILSSYAEYEPVVQRNALFESATPNILKQTKWFAQDVAMIAKAFSRAEYYSAAVLRTFIDARVKYSPLERSAFLNAVAQLYRPGDELVVGNCFAAHAKAPLGNEPSVRSVTLNAFAKVGCYDANMVDTALRMAFNGLPLIHVLTALAKFNHRPMRQFWDFGRLDATPIEHCALLLHSATKLDLRGWIIGKTLVRCAKVLHDNAQDDLVEVRLVGMLLDACLFAASSRCLSQWDPHERQAWAQVTTWVFEQARHMMDEADDQFQYQLNFALLLLSALPYDFQRSLSCRIWKACAVPKSVSTITAGNFHPEVVSVLQRMGCRPISEKRVQEQMYVDIVL